MISVSVAVEWSVYLIVRYYLIRLIRFFSLSHLKARFNLDKNFLIAKTNIENYQKISIRINGQIIKALFRIPCHEWGFFFILMLRSEKVIHFSGSTNWGVYRDKEYEKVLWRSDLKYQFPKKEKPHILPPLNLLYGENAKAVSNLRFTNDRAYRIVSLMRDHHQVGTGPENGTQFVPHFKILSSNNKATFIKISFSFLSNLFRVCIFKEKWKNVFVSDIRFICSIYSLFLLFMRVCVNESGCTNPRVFLFFCESSFNFWKRRFI